MKFSSVIVAALVAASTVAQDVACRVNGVQQSVVDLDTGVCPFTIPSQFPTNFRYDGADDYLVDAYYVTVGQRYFNNIPEAGRTISVPARLLYGQPGAPLFHIHAEESPSSNSTASIRRRFNSKLLDKRDEESDFVSTIEAMNGEAAGDTEFSVSDPDTSSSAGASSGAGESTTSGASSGAEGTATVTDLSTTIVTITSCSDNKCSETTVPATWGATTETVEGETTVYTTWCPETGAVTVTDLSTTIVTITSCSDHKCAETTVPATWGATTETVEGGETTVYTTWCPATGAETTTEYSTTVVTVTSCSDNKCEETTVPATWGATTETVEGVETVYTTWCPATGAEETTVYTTVATSTGAEGETVYTTTVTTAATPATEGTTEGTGAAAETTTVYTSVVTSTGAEGETTEYTTTVTSAGTVAAESTVEGETTAATGETTAATGETTTLATVTTGSSAAAGSASPVISTSFNGAAKVGGSLIALVAIPFAYLL